MFEILTTEIILKSVELVRHEGMFRRVKRRCRRFATLDAKARLFY